VVVKFSSTPFPTPFPRQSGAALIILMILIVLVISSALLWRLNARGGPGTFGSESATHTTHTLQAAKEALLAFAATYPDFYPTGAPNTTEGPGQLPCPDVDGDGFADGPCGSAGAPAVGRLPWSQLGLADLRDGDAEPLWYAVSGAHKDDPPTTPLNTDTPGSLTLDGSGDVVAVIVAPGAALAGQARPSTNVTDYLEGENSDGDDDFQTGPSGAAFNDRLLTVTRAELARTVERRVLAEIRRVLSQYWTAYGYYPALRPFDLVYGVVDDTKDNRIHDKNHPDGDFDKPPLSTKIAVGDIGYVDRGATSHVHIRIKKLLKDDLELDVVGPNVKVFKDEPYEVRKRSGRLPAALYPAHTMPDWFFSNKWEMLTHVALASTVYDGCTPTPCTCTAGTSCLTLVGAPAPVNDNEVVLLSAGPALPGQARPSNSVADYFESLTVGGTLIDNADGDDVFVRGPASATFNDQSLTLPP
jgi:hypothetical protein